MKKLKLLSVLIVGSLSFLGMPTSQADFGGSPGADQGTGGFGGGQGFDPMKGKHKHKHKSKSSWSESVQTFQSWGEGEGGWGGWGEGEGGHYHGKKGKKGDMEMSSEGFPNDVGRNEGDTRQRTGTAEAASQSGISGGRSPGAVTGVDLIHTDREMNPMQNTGLGGRDR